MASAFQAVLDQALQLPEAERGELASRLLRSLDLEGPEGEALSTQAWEAAWSAELDRRVREIRAGKVDLVDGDDVLAELREIAERP